MPMIDAFSGGISGLNAGLLTGMQVFGQLGAQRAQAAREQRIQQLALLESEGKIIQGAIQAMDMPPAERKIALALFDQQAKQIQTMKGQDPVGLGDTFLQLATKADEERAPLYKALLEKHGVEYLQGNPQALTTLKDPVTFIGNLHKQNREDEELANKKANTKLIQDILGPSLGTPGPAIAQAAEPQPLNRPYTGIPEPQPGQPPGPSPIEALPGTPPMSVPPAGPGPRPLPPGMSVNLGPQGGSVSLRGLTVKTDLMNKALPDGRYQPTLVQVDESGRIVKEQPFGAPMASEDLARIRRAASAIYPEGTPEFDAAVKRLSLAPENLRAEVIAQMEQHAAGRGGVPTIGGALKAAEVRGTAEAAAKVQAQETARLPYEAYQRRLKAHDEVTAQLDQMETIVGQIEEAGKQIKVPDSWSRMTGAAQREWSARAQSDPNAVILQSKIGELGPLIRALGEKGTLAEGDVQRGQAMSVGLHDTDAVKAKKISELRGIIRLGRETAQRRLGPAPKGAEGLDTSRPAILPPPVDPQSRRRTYNPKTDTFE